MHGCCLPVALLQTVSKNASEGAKKCARERDFERDWHELYPKAMSDKRARLTGRSSKVYGNVPVNILPKYVTSSDEWRAMSPIACKLLSGIIPQFNGRQQNNNGYLMILMRQPKRYGFKSVGTLTAARDELVRRGFIQLTRQGGRHQASLYAITWEPIKNARGLEVPADTMPSHLWQQENESRRDPPPMRLQKNRNRAPTSGTLNRRIALVAGTQPSAIAPSVGAVRVASDGFRAPVDGTYS